VAEHWGYPVGGGGGATLGGGVGGGVLGGGGGMMFGGDDGTGVVGRVGIRVFDRKVEGVVDGREPLAFWYLTLRA
jgi:hypothetical protein